jgi:hypothetical protein
MVPPPATVAPETSLCPRAGTDGPFGWLVRLCVKTLMCLVQIESATSFFVSTTSLAKAPNGSIKEAVLSHRVNFLNFLPTDICAPAECLMKMFDG